MGAWSSLDGNYEGEHARLGCSVAELYELVQHAGNILPRMYLLVTVASVFISTKEAAAKDVLKDVVEMTRGVQHPLRGLFLRAYLAQMSKVTATAQEPPSFRETGDVWRFGARRSGDVYGEGEGYREAGTGAPMRHQADGA